MKSFALLMDEWLSWEVLICASDDGTRMLIRLRQYSIAELPKCSNYAPSDAHPNNLDDILFPGQVRFSNPSWNQPRLTSG
jgi:hypothetical protein